MITPVFNGTVTEGKLNLIDREKFIIHISTLEGKSIEVIVRRKYSKKTDKENKYFRGVVVPIIAKHCGYTDDKMFGILQVKFFLYEDEKGEKYIRSTRLEEWKTIEWEEKMSKIRQWASEFLHLFVPKPNESELY